MLDKNARAAPIQAFEGRSVCGSPGKPRAGEDGTIHTNPKRKRGRELHPRLRFGLVSASTA